MILLIDLCVLLAMAVPDGFTDTDPHILSCSAHTHTHTRVNLSNWGPASLLHSSLYAVHLLLCVSGLCSGNPFQLFSILITLNTGQPALMFKVVMEPVPVPPRPSVVFRLFSSDVAVCLTCPVLRHASRLVCLRDNLPAKLTGLRRKVVNTSSLRRESFAADCSRHSSEHGLTRCDVV